jgi:predicted PurR-regulated permease PerM
MDPGGGGPGRPVDAWQQHRALAVAAVAALVAMAWLSSPFAMGLFLGALMGFTLQPLYWHLARDTRRPFGAALAVVFGTALVVIGAVAAFASVFVTEAVALTRSAIEQLQPGGPLSAWVHTVSGWLGRIGLSEANLADRVRGAATEIASRSAALAGTFASTTLGGLLSLFFALLTMHVVLRHWDGIVAQIEVLSPLRPEYTRALLADLRRVGRTTLVGTVATGLAQGALAAIGYWMTGVPKPLFLGVATAIASIVPAVGTLLVWIPVGVFLFATGQPGRAVAELVWGALVVVGFSDYVIRPRLVGDEAMPPLLTFVALFGGLETMGLKGLIAGPVLMALAVTVLRLYTREALVARAAAPR